MASLGQWDTHCHYPRWGHRLLTHNPRGTYSFAKCHSDLTPAPTNDLSSSQANFDGNYPAGSAAKGPYLKRPCDVGLYVPNPLGIYDLHGNVWEWTSSVCEGGSAQVFRGGKWGISGSLCTAANRFRNAQGEANHGVGFRLLAVPSS
jgi:formylglycine-generating enzyme required for sulfatase activity